MICVTTQEVLVSLEYEYFRDDNSAFEAFKAGLIDLWRETDPKRWQTGYNFPAARDGRIIKKEIKTGIPSGLRGFVFNTRNKSFKNTEVRHALSLVFNFDWINKDQVLAKVDEEFNELQPWRKDYMTKNKPLIEKYKNKNELTMLLASHNMKEVERLCNKVIMMKQGKIVDSGTCKELIKKHGRENLEDTFLKIARSKNELE